MYSQVNHNVKKNACENIRSNLQSVKTIDSYNFFKSLTCNVIEDICWNKTGNSINFELYPIF